MQFALLRTLYEQYTWYEDDGVTAHYPIFLMDAEALGGVLIKKLLVQLKPKGFDIEKDLALMETKFAMSKGRDYYESEVDGAVIERNLSYGVIESYYIDEMSEQLGMYHIEDEKLTTDFVMMLMMGVSYIMKKLVNIQSKPVKMNRLVNYRRSRI